MKHNLFRLSLLAILFSMVIGHTYHTGQCPSVEPQSPFDMNKFLGIWYAVQKTSTASACVTYNITRGDEPGEYKIEQQSQHFVLGLTPLKHDYSYTGILTVPDNSVSGKMDVKFPLNIAGSSSFTVFMTDYEKYGGIFSCQKLGFTHRRSATLLSRTKTLDKMYIDKMRTRLQTYFVDPFELSIINQNDCPKVDEENKGVNIHIDENTFTAQSVANVFRKAGEKIGDGVEYAVEAGKKLYHQLSDNDESATINPNSEKSARSYSKPEDAEWMRF